jgi:hypothetical protein
MFNMHKVLAVPELQCWVQLGKVSRQHPWEIQPGNSDKQKWSSLPPFQRIDTAPVLDIKCFCPRNENLPLSGNLPAMVDAVLPGCVQMVKVPGEGRGVPLELRRHQIGILLKVGVAFRHPRLLWQRAERRLRHGGTRKQCRSH